MGEEKERQEGVQLGVGHQGLQGWQDFALAQVTVIVGGEKQAVGGSIFIKKRRGEGDRFQGKGYGGQGEIVYSLVKIILCSQRVAEILGADCR